MPLERARNHPGVTAGIVAAAGLAWWLTVRRMAGMDAAPGSDLGTLGWFTGSWVVMMAAMMLPSFVPTIAAYATLTRRPTPTKSLLFTGGYLLVWTAVGVAAYALFEFGRHTLASDLAWHGVGRWAAGGVIALAAAYQFTPMKRACLMRCRGQLGDLPRVSSPGNALAIGVRSGSWCLGCSWALMAALFALGVMSLTWMALIAALVAVEKVGPWPSAAKLATACVLALLAVGVLAAPAHVPGLVLPRPAGMHAMSAMR